MTAKRQIALLVAALAPGVAGCVGVAEFRELEKRVTAMERADASGPDPGGSRPRVAALAAEQERLMGEIARLEGRIDVAEHQASEALEESRAAAAAAARDDAVWPEDTPESEPEAGPAATPPAANGEASTEIAAYREAYETSRGNDPQVCIEHFREFLQSYPSSNLADDAAYWMADCHFRDGELKKAVLGFNDVVEEYPEGNKAADALYRQGQALLRLGPRYASAAGKAFERVIVEYPDSERVAEAKQQLEVLGSR